MKEFIIWVLFYTVGIAMGFYIYDHDLINACEDKHQFETFYKKGKINCSLQLEIEK